MRVRTKKRICIAIGLVSFFAMFVFVGCMDSWSIPVAKGAGLSMTAMIVGAAMMWKAGVLKR